MNPEFCSEWLARIIVCDPEIYKIEMKIDIMDEETLIENIID